VRRLLGVLALCLALAACGKSTEEKYKEGFPPINRGLVVLGEDVGQGLRSANDRTLAAAFSAYARRLDGLRERLDGLEPPDSLSKEHEALLAAMTAVHGSLADVAGAAGRGDATAARDAATRLVRGEAGLDAVRGELARAVRAL
jgi:hypothetical protein